MFQGDTEVYEFSDFRLDVPERLLLRHDKRVPLSEKAFEMLCVLVRHGNHLVSKDDLLAEVWSGVIVEENNLDKTVSRLRQVLGEREGKEKFIETIRGHGYRFLPEVRLVELKSAEKAGKLFTAREPEISRRHKESPPPAVSRPQSNKVVALADWRGALKEDEKPITTAAETESPAVNRRKSTLIAASAFGFLILALVVFALFRGGSQTSTDGEPLESIAVLPFENATGNADLEYLADGLSESVIDRLSQLPQLKVIARTSSFKYRGQNVDFRDAAAKLGARAIVTGRITQRGDHLLIRVEMIDVRENRQLWSEQFNRKAADALDVQEEIARAASEKLRVNLSGAEEKLLAKSHTQNPEAYGLYLRGRFLQNKHNPPDLIKSLEYYEQAVALDPNFALAYVGLAESTGRLNRFRDLPTQNYKEMSREYVFKAITLDDQLAEAHATFGSMLSVYDYDFGGAEREYERALELNPNYPEGHLWRGQLLSSFGRHEEALAEIRRGLELDPVSLEANSAYGEALFYARRYDESIAQLKKTLELDANYFPAHRLLAFNYGMKGDYAARVAESVKINEIGGAPQRGVAMQKSFQEGGWQGFLRDNCENKFDLHAYLVATFCAELGEKDKAFAVLNKIYEERGGELVFLKIDPRLDNLRADPRFADLLRRVGLP